MDEGDDREEEMLGKQVEARLKAVDLPACVQERDEDPNGRALCAPAGMENGPAWLPHRKRNKKKKVKRSCLATAKEKFSWFE